VAKNLKGITIEIGGNTTKLGKALEDSEKKSRSLQTELRQIQQSLKFNPENVEILAQKQTVLTQNIAETSEKLDTLKEAERQVIAQFERGEVAEEQVRALQREIIKTENQLDSMGDELKSTVKLMEDIADGTRDAEKKTEEYAESLADAEKELEDFGNTAGEAFDKVKMGVGVLAGATVAGAGYALNLSTEFDKAFNQLIAQTGATEGEFEDLNSAMENVYKNNFGESMEDVARSMATVYNNTGLYGKELEKASENALMLRDVFEFEVNESSRSAKMLMDQFGLSAEEAYNFIANGAQNGLDKNGDLLDTINEYAVHFKQLGLDSDDMFNMLVNGAESGTFSVDKLGDAVKEFGVRVKDGSKTTVEGFTALGLDADEMAKKFGQGGESAKEALLKTAEALFAMEDPIAQNTAGVNLFGTMWEDLGVEGVKALMDLNGGSLETRDALGQLNEVKYDDIGSALQGLGRTLQTDLVDPIGDELKPVVEDAIEYVQDNGPAIKEVISNIVTAVGNFIKAVVDNKDVILATIVGIGAGLLAWNVVGIITTVVGAVKNFITVLKAGKTVMQALNIVMGANPIGIIIALIAGLVAGFIYLWNNCEGFRNFWIGLWEGIKSAVSVAVEWISEAFNSIISFFTDNWQSILLFILNPFAGAFSYLYENFEGFRNFVDGIISSIKEFFVNLWAKIVEIFTPLVEWFGALFSSIADTISSIIAVIVGLIRGCWAIIVAVFGIAYEWFNNTVIQPIKNAFSAFWSMISNLGSKAWTGIKNIWSVVSGWFNKTIISPVSNFFSNMWNKLKTGASQAWTGIKSVFSNVTTWFRDKFSQAWTAVKNVFSTGGKVFSGITEGISSAFKKVVNAIISGINKVVAVPFNTINGVLTTLRNASIAGIKPFAGLPSLSVPQIPLLYRGGILRKGQIGLLEGNGAEAVVPLEKETGWINRIAQKMNELQEVNSNASNVALASKMDEMIRTMKTLKSTIVLDTGTLVGETINQIDEQLGNNYSLRERRI
jgi:phage-related minor tail protein